MAKLSKLLADLALIKLYKLNIGWQNTVEFTSLILFLDHSHGNFYVLVILVWMPPFRTYLPACLKADRL